MSRMLERMGYLSTCRRAPGCGIMVGERGQAMYTLHFYDRDGELQTEKVKTKATAIALAKQAIGRVWVTDDKGEIVYEREADASQTRP